ncbi:MAG: MBL fold metallo-hydrolase [Pseudomonadales bacterium]|nr:MBL fold metallo-hydrolase [Gammaproteobacteria bacterium]NNL57803.1 MBL fold metallo-hydrolase [Pseudomonadales bacterium]
MVRYLIAIVITLLLVSTTQAENHHAASPAFKSVKVADNIFMLQGKGGNVAVLTTAAGLLMIDDDYKQMTPALLRAIEPFGGTKALKYVINTHWHGDHTQGNAELGRHAAIVAHHNVRERLNSRQEIKLFNMVSEPYAAHALPSITYQSAMHLHLGDETIELMHFANAHTDGDSVVRFTKANVVHMGDLYFNGFFPFVDIASGGNVVTLAKNVAEVLRSIDKNTVVIPGHGPLSNKTELKRYKKMLEGTVAEVRKMQKRGLSLAQMQERGLSAKWDKWADGFLSPAQWIALVHDSF